MKKQIITFVFSLLIFTFSYSQEQNAEPLAFSEVVKVDTAISANELFSRARTWFAETYRSAQDVIQMEDKEEGKIVGKGAIEYVSNVFVGSQGTKGLIRYTLTISVKKGRYKFDMTNFNHEGNPANGPGPISFGLITTSEDCPAHIQPKSVKGWKNKVWKDLKKDIDTNSSVLIASLKAAMNKPAKDEKDGW
jgi:hypothetical protein